VNPPPTQPVTFGEALDHYATLRPKEPQLLCALQDGSVATLTREQVRHWSNRLACALMEAGVDVGVIVPIDLPTGNTFLVAAAAVFKAGGTPMPVSYRLPAPERSALLALAEPIVVVSDRGGDYPVINPMEHAYGDIVTEALPRRVTQPIKALASGGSTGKPKLILTTGAFEQNLGQIPVAQMLRIREEDLKYSPGPLYHNGPFWFSVNTLFSGATVLLNERFDATRAIELIEEYKPTVLNLVPTMMQRMLRARNWESADLSAVRVIWHLAAPCPAWAKRGFIDKFGGETVLELWAATEATGLTVIDGNDWLAHPGSVGKPYGTEVLIVDADRKPLPNGQVGEIFTRFAGLDAPYEYRGSAPLETVGEGFASVGDLGWLDDEGYLYLADRRTDMIISGGANIFPAEIEAVISTHPEVVDVAVIGLKDEDLGRRVHAVIEPKDINAPPGVADIQALCEQQLVRYKVPRGFEFVAQLPRNDAGKIRRSAMRDERESCQ